MRHGVAHTDLDAGVAAMALAGVRVCVGRAGTTQSPLCAHERHMAARGDNCTAGAGTNNRAAHMAAARKARYRCAGKLRGNANLYVNRGEGSVVLTREWRRRADRTKYGMPPKDTER